MQQYSSVYIDESGDNGSSSRYIVFAVIATDAERPLEKLVKRIWRTLPQAAVAGELHANRTGAETKRKLLAGLNRIDADCYYSVIDKAKVKIPMQDAYYLELARIIAFFQTDFCMIVVDKKETDRKRNQILARLRLTEKFAPVRFEHSHHIKQLQAADFVAWAVGRHFERGDSSFMSLISRLERL